MTRMVYYDMLKRWTNGEPLRWRIEAEPFDKSMAAFDQLVDAAPKAGSLNQRLKDVLGPRYAWVDALAVYCSHNYRSIYVMTYLLSALAVLIALGGAFVATAHQKAILVALEVFAVASIVQLVRYGRSQWLA